jgi:hypothetical protein
MLCFCKFSLKHQRQRRKIFVEKITDNRLRCSAPASPFPVRCTLYSGSAKGYKYSAALRLNHLFVASSKRPAIIPVGYYFLANSV